MAAPSSRRSALESLLGAPTAALLAVVLFALVNFLAARHYRRFDWTHNRMFTLSAQSRSIVRQVHEPVDLYVLLGEREPQYKDVSELAQRYASENSMVHLHTIDPDRQRDRFLDLTRRLGLRVATGGSDDLASIAAIVLVKGDRHWEVRRDALGGLTDPSEGESAEHSAASSVTIERAISEGILHVDHSEEMKVCFSTGHGELPLEGNDESVSAFAAELRHENFTVTGVPITGSTAVPADCDALVIASVQQAFAQGEADIVTRYLRAGGNVLMLVDPNTVDRRFVPTGLEPVAALGGIELTQSVVIEPDAAHQLPGQLPVTFLATDMGDHAITHEYRGEGARVLVATARALRRITSSTAIPESLLRTTAGAWGETNIANVGSDGAPTKDSQDIEGPLHLAMASQVPDVHPTHAGREAAGRLVVVGFSHLITNEADSIAAQARFADFVFALSSVGWLTARRELVEIPPRASTVAALNLSSEQLRWIQFYAFLLIPALAALLGVVTWFSRRQQ